MRRALELARRGVGLTRPNPPVGAVLVRDGLVVGEGWHQAAGGPHAEIHALRAAGEAARGATLYVTLEPCSTHGRTPPCTEAILRAGCARVVISALDPNPRHAGRGVELLRASGVAVVVSVLAEEGNERIAPFASWVTRGRPRVLLKMAATLDGRIADAEGRSRWITGPEARAVVHAARRASDAILVGRVTAEQDDPSLLPIPDEGRAPWRVVLDAQGRLPPTLKLFTDDARARTLVAVTENCPPAYRPRLEEAGVGVMTLPSLGGRVDLPALMEELGRRDVMQVLCEGGGRLAAALLRAQLVDELWWMMAPRVLGGAGIPAVDDTGWTLEDMPAWRWAAVERVGEDLWIRAVRKED